MHAFKRKLILGAAVSAVFLFLSTRGIDWSEFRDAFANARYEFLIPGVIATLLGHFSRALRWKFMMSPIKECAIGRLWSATAIAFLPGQFAT